MGLKNLIIALFQLDKDWTTRIVMAMLVMGVIWGLLGVIDSLMVRLQETTWGTSALLIETSQEYYGAITLHAERDLFGFAQQVEFALFIYFTIKLLNLQPKAKWLLNISFILINISMMFMEGPIVVYPTFNDNYFSATDWYYLSPMGIPSYSQYVVSPLFFTGWLLLDAFTYLAGIWIIYHYYIAAKTLKEKLPIGLVFFLMDTLLYTIGYSGVTAADIWDVLAYAGIVRLDPIANQIAFWIFGHAIVYMAWLPAVGAMYLLIPILANKPLYSDRMGRISALLYLIFSNNVPIHHLYMVNLPVGIKILQEVLTYAVVVPSMMTFFNLWATTKGAQVNWNIITAFISASFAGAIAAGVTGIANATIAFDSIVHNSMWVVGHFHAMILLSIVPAAMAVLYFMIPMMSGRQWYSAKLAWTHFIGYIIGAVMLIIGMEMIGFYGIVRRAEIYPRFEPGLVFAENLATVGALIAELATLGWFLNLVLTLVKGRTAKLEGLGVGELINTVAMSLSWENANMSSLIKFNNNHKISRSMLKKALGIDWVLGIIGALFIIASAIPLSLGGNMYNAAPWAWIVLLTIGIVMIAYPVLRGSKSI
ncbi:cbb3-type cytochrome c oxidase subunit I [Acidianus brierleyi]|uniref:Oxidase n=1 Tax=Acidianus brierleyi TaxID=41673 RepID=A0A2U9IFI5_9CREN|nr:cbb3-type cytochrome c oxidase subunit I [Acidianus brierleyi]AWR94704.1 oxidase [Acidianus brierleyi]